LLVEVEGIAFSRKETTPLSGIDGATLDHLAWKSTVA
jgi:hypothetical protein